MGNSFRIASVGIHAHAANTKQCQIYRQTRLTSQSQNHTQGKSPSYYTIAYILKGFSLTHTMPSITEPKPYIRKITPNHNTVEGISQFFYLCHCLSHYITEQLFSHSSCAERQSLSLSPVKYALLHLLRISHSFSAIFSLPSKLHRELHMLHGYHYFQNPTFLSLYNNLILLPDTFFLYQMAVGFLFIVSKICSGSPSATFTLLFCTIFGAFKTSQIVLLPPQHVATICHLPVQPNDLKVSELDSDSLCKFSTSKNAAASSQPNLFKNPFRCLPNLLLLLNLPSIN